MKEEEVGYRTEVVKRYVADVRAARTVHELRAKLDEWAWLAPDGAAVAHLLCPRTFTAFRSGLVWDARGWGDPAKASHEQHREWLKWAKLHGPLLMPARALALTLGANHFSVPDGLFWRRLKDADAATPGFLADWLKRADEEFSPKREAPESPAG